MSGHFEIDASGYVQGLAAEQNVSLQPDLEALQASAAAVHTQLPEEPRLLVMAEGERPQTPWVRVITQDRKYLPEYTGKDDVLVFLQNLHLDRRLTEDRLTQGILLAFLKEKRTVQNHAGKRLGAAAFLGGITMSGIGEVITHRPVITGAGTAILAAGLCVAGYFSNRGDAKLPDTRGLNPPIRLVPRGRSPSATV